MTNWYNLNPKTARGLVLIIARSGKVIKITAGKLFSLSIATFGDVSNVYINIIFIIFIYYKLSFIARFLYIHIKIE